MVVDSCFCLVTPLNFSIHIPPLIWLFGRLVIIRMTRMYAKRNSKWVSFLKHFEHELYYCYYNSSVLTLKQEYIVQSTKPAPKIYLYCTDALSRASYKFYYSERCQSSQNDSSILITSLSRTIRQHKHNFRA